MNYLPVFLDIRGQRCLLVGGGDVASRKARAILQAGGQLHVVARELSPSLQHLLHEQDGHYRQGEYQSADLTGAVLVVAATDDSAINKRVHHDCRQQRIPVNVVDQPELCSFIFPSIVNRDPLVLAISSSGKSPVMARMIREQLEATLPARLGDVASLAGELRKTVSQELTDDKNRRHFWEQQLHGRFAELALQGKNGEARNQLLQNLQHAAEAISAGEVYLVGAGPGDPDLLTFRALRLMQQADVIVYDRLVSAAVLDLCRRDAERIYVGKARSAHTMAQENINELLVRLARSGKRVCRLKGGDPFIFGRGGEEIEELAEAGIAFQVVPGITAASGCSAYAGIPLTHRDHAQSVRFVTGHLKAGAPELPWPELIHERQTLVLYMGLVGLETICQKLIQHGMAPDMPVALVSHGTTPEQKVVEGTLSDIAAKVEKSGITAPTLTIIGRVVSLREKLDWFSNK